MAYCRPQAPLPNPLRRFFSAEWFFVTKLGPQVSPFPVPIFGINTNILGNYVRDVDICTQLYYSFIDTT
jgi:hypothetical protein